MNPSADASAIVVSYSRKDQAIIRMLVDLLTAALAPFHKVQPVFWDHNLEFGSPWRDQIETAIAQAQQLFVFWCAHAAVSKEVADECKFALGISKTVVPVLLDNTALPPELGGIHGVNLIECGLHRDWSAYGPEREPDPLRIERRSLSHPTQLLVSGALQSVARFASVFGLDGKQVEASVAERLQQHDTGDELLRAITAVNPTMFQIIREPSGTE